MRVLVDGHNALFALKLGGRGRTHEHQRRELLRRVAELAPQATVFFDARHAPHRIGIELGLSAVFCRDQEADAVILEQVRAADDPREITVVSNDRELAGRAAQLGARVQRVHEFFRRLPDAGSFAGEAHGRDRQGEREHHGVRGRGREGREGAEDRRSPRILRGRWRFVPADFGLPDYVDLSDPGDI